MIDTTIHIIIIYTNVIIYILTVGGHNMLTLQKNPINAPPKLQVTQGAYIGLYA